MPGLYTRQVKLWARVLIAAVTVARRMTRTTCGNGLLLFALAHGFVWLPKPTVPQPTTEEKP